jgi:ubiquinone/menaquinone biosynthesis C-methylase UbiE
VPAEIKACCAAVYETEWARLLLGASFHPGGLALTSRLGRLLGLEANSVVVDAACGRGASALHLARTFGCRVIGLDLGEENIAAAKAAAREAGLAGRVTFGRGDAEQLPLDSGLADAVICECAYCTFPDKALAAAEFARVLKPGGRIGISDLSRTSGLSEVLRDLLAWVACIADARPREEYIEYLNGAGFTGIQSEQHIEALLEMVQEIRGKLLGAELLSKLKSISLPGVDFERARLLAREAEVAVRERKLGYVLITAAKAVNTV